MTSWLLLLVVVFVDVPCVPPVLGGSGEPGMLGMARFFRP